MCMSASSCILVLILHTYFKEICSSLPSAEIAVNKVPVHIINPIIKPSMLSHPKEIKLGALHLELLTA